MNEINFSILYASILHLAANSDEDLWVSSFSTSYEEANKICDNLGKHFPNIAETTEYAITMRQKDVNGWWLPIRNHRFNIWQKTGGGIYGPHIIDPRARKMYKFQDCAVLRSVDGYLDEEHCNETRLDYVCSHVGAKCPDEADCLHVPGNISFFFMDGNGTWFDALMACQKYNSQLASFNNSQLNGILEEIGRLQVAGHFAVGIYRSGWYLDPYTINKDILQTYNWGPKQPAPGSNCAVVVPHLKGQPYWKAVQCSERYHFICVSSNLTWVTSTTVATTINTTTDEKQMQKPDIHSPLPCSTLKCLMADAWQRYMWVVILVVTLLSLIVILMVARFVVMCQKKINRGNIQPHPVEIVTEDQIKLQEHDSDKNECETILPKYEIGQEESRIYDEESEESAFIVGNEEDVREEKIPDTTNSAKSKLGKRSGNQRMMSSSHRSGRPTMPKTT